VAQLAAGINKLLLVLESGKEALRDLGGHGCILGTTAVAH
jgi:hypothetical protein